MRLAHATPLSILTEIGDVASRLGQIEWFLRGAEIADAPADFGLVRRYAWPSADGRLGAAEYFGLIDGKHVVWAELRRIRASEPLTCGRILVDDAGKGRGLGRALYRHMVVVDGLELMSGPNHTQYSKRMYEGFMRDRNLLVLAIDPKTGERFGVTLGPEAIEVGGTSIYRQGRDLRLLVRMAAASVT